MNLMITLEEKKKMRRQMYSSTLEEYSLFQLGENDDDDVCCCSLTPFRPRSSYEKKITPIGIMLVVQVQGECGHR